MSNYRLTKDSLKKTIHSFENKFATIKYLHTGKVHLIIDKPLKLKDNKYRINPKSDKKVLYFAKKMERKYSASTLNLMYKNLREEKHNQSYADLLSLASTNEYGNQIFKGFSHTSKTILGKNTIGKGLNVGYRDYLAKNIFGSPNIEVKNYALKESMDIIVKVVGKEKMDKYFFSNNLKDLRSNLAKYSSYPETDAFIIDTDLFLINKNNYQKIINYLDKLYRNKLKSDLEEEIIDYNYVEEELDYLEQQLDIIKNIICIQDQDEYYSYVKQCEVGKKEYEKEKIKENIRRIIDIW